MGKFDVTSGLDDVLGRLAAGNAKHLLMALSRHGGGDAVVIGGEITVIEHRNGCFEINSMRDREFTFDAGQAAFSLSLHMRDLMNVALSASGCSDEVVDAVIHCADCNCSNSEATR